MLHEKHTFERWLFSDRNIKIALYSGSSLLILAGIIFIGTNWSTLSDPLQLALVLAMTAAMHTAGLLLLRASKNLRVGALALLAVAGGFAPLNFILLQQKILLAEGVDARWTWLIGSLLCLLFYTDTVRRTKAHLPTYFAAIAALSAYSAFVSLLALPAVLSLLLLALPPILLLTEAWRWRDISYLHQPLHVVAHLTAPLLWLTNTVLWFDGIGWLRVENDDPVPLLLAMLLGAGFYATNDWLYAGKWERWLSATIFTLTVILIVLQLQVSFPLACLFLLGLAVGFLAIAYERNASETGALNQISEKTLPLLLCGYALVLFTNWLALFGTETFNLHNLAFVLVGDTIILVLSAHVFRNELYAYSAALLFSLPVALYTNLWFATSWSPSIFGQTHQIVLLPVALLLLGILYLLLSQRTRLSSVPNQSILHMISGGLLLMSLSLASQKMTTFGLVALATIGTIFLFRRLYPHWGWFFVATFLILAPITIYTELYFHTDFYLAVAYTIVMGVYTVASWRLWRQKRPVFPLFILVGLLSIATPILVDESVFALCLLTAISVGYAFFAWQAKREVVLAVALLFLTWGVYVLERMAHFSDEQGVVLFALFGGCLFVVGLILRYRHSWGRKAFYTIATLNLLVAYLLGVLELSSWSGSSTFELEMIVFSFVWAGFILVWISAESHPLLHRTKDIFAWVATTVAILLITLGHFLLMDYLSNDNNGPWTIITALLCASFIGIGYLCRSEPFHHLYGIPFRVAGYAISMLPLWKAFHFDVEVTALTWGIIAIVVLLDGKLRDNLMLFYAGISLLVATCWTLQIDHLQAYSLPLGAALIIIGQYEHHRNQTDNYLILTLAGISLLLGSAFFQSFAEPHLTWLVIVEGCLTVVWGIATQSRNFVRLGIAALLVRGILLFERAFSGAELFSQVGVIGFLLLGGGLLALFYREQILTTHAVWRDKWNRW